MDKSPAEDELDPAEWERWLQRVQWLLGGELLGNKSGQRRVRQPVQRPVGGYEARDLL